MATKKTNSFGTADLEFALRQIDAWEKYLTDNPIDKIEDRYGDKELMNGRVVRAVISTREQITKNVMDINEKYLKMLAVIKDLKRKDEEDKQMRKGFETDEESVVG